jgi:plastocyanin
MSAHASIRAVAIAAQALGVRRLLALALMACALSLPAMRQAGAAATPGGPVVDITKFAYAPKDITVAPGTRVVWINRDETPHTVTGTDKSFGSKGMDTDDRFEHTFDREGDFSYLCTVHPFMTGVVHVRKP